MNTSQISVPKSNGGTAFPIEKPSVAFIGRAGSGKTTAAEYLERCEGFTRLSFATALKQCAKRIWGPTAATDRDKLQKLGIAVREIDPDAWVAALLQAVVDFKTTRLEVPQIAIDDCRFPNEYDALTELGFVIVRVEADEAVRINRLQLNGKFHTREQLEHVSETAADELPVDYTIRNEGSPEAFGAEVAKVLFRTEARV